MKILSDQTTLVLAGAWNAAILNPNWIGRHILGVPPGHAFQVNMLMPVQGIGDPLRMTFEGISISARSDALIFHLQAEEDMSPATGLDVARQILEALPHTPISAMGINFLFSVDPDEGKLGKTFEWADELGETLTSDPEAKITGRNWQLSIASRDHLVNVTFNLALQGATIAINHHYEVEGSAAKAAKILSNKELFDSLRAESFQLVGELTKVGE